MSEAAESGRRDELVVTGPQVAACPLAIDWLESSGQSDFSAVPLGPWAREFISLGRKLSGLTGDKPKTLALAVPTLDLAATFVACGLVIASAEQQHQAAASPNKSIHLQDALFDQLCSLPIGSPVRLALRTKDQVLASFEGTSIVHGERYAHIQFTKETKTKGGKAKELINKRNVNRVFFAPGNNVKRAERHIGKTVDMLPGLADAFVSDSRAVSQLLLRQSLDCAIVGVLTALKVEIVDTKFRATSREGEPPAVGHLQHILRAPDFLEPGETSRTEIVPLRGKWEARATGAPPFVIFRGASAYLRRAADFPTANHCVFLSSVEYDFEPAVAVLNEAYLNSVEEFPSEDLHFPQGIQAMGFVRASVS